MGKEFISGRTSDLTKVTGEIIKCTEREYSAGKMAANILASTLKIERRATENSVGPTVGFTEASGIKESSMVKAGTTLVVECRSMESGGKAKDIKSTIRTEIAYITFYKINFP